MRHCMASKVSDHQCGIWPKRMVVARWNCDRFWSTITIRCALFGCVTSQGGHNPSYPQDKTCPARLKMTRVKTNELKPGSPNLFFIQCLNNEPLQYRFCFVYPMFGANDPTKWKSPPPLVGDQRPGFLFFHMIQNPSLWFCIEIKPKLRSQPDVTISRAHCIHLRRSYCRLKVERQGFQST